MMPGQHGELISTGYYRQDDTGQHGVRISYWWNDNGEIKRHTSFYPCGNEHSAEALKRLVDWRAEVKQLLDTSPLPPRCDECGHGHDIGNPCPPDERCIAHVMAR